MASKPNSTNRGRSGWRIVAAVAFVATGLVAVGAVVQAARAATFPPDHFLDIGGTIQKDAVAAAAGWSNNGTATTGCANGGVHIAGSVGLFDCGALAGTSTTPFPVTNQTPATNAALDNANGVFQTQFTIDQLNNSFTNCPGGVQTGSNQFGGGQKFTDDPSADTYSLGSVPGKDEISNVYAVARQNSANQDEVYVGLERVVNNGDTHADFQFLQEPVAETTACSGKFTGSAHEQGDVVLEINFTNGGSTPSANVLIWSCTGSLTGVQAPVGTTCRGTNPVAPYKNATWMIEPACAVGVVGLCYDPAAVSVATNTSDVPCGAWVCRDSSANPIATVPALEFMEGAVNLDGLGINLNCAATFFPLTRSAGSGVTSQIQSFAPPTKFQTCAGTTTTTSPSASTVTLGNTATDAATVTRSFGTGAPSGSTAFYACGPFATAPTTNPICTPTSANATSVGSPVSSPTATTGTSVTYTSSAFTAPAAGYWCFDAEFTPGSGTRLTGSSDSTQSDQAQTECFHVTALTPTVDTTIAVPASTALGNTWGDSATVTGTSPYGAPAGTVAWTLCQETAPATPCSGGTALGSTSTATTTGNAATFTLPAADDAVPTGVGTWCFNTTFTSTSVDYKSANGTAECFTVTKAGSTTATTVSPVSLVLGPDGKITDTVTVTGSTAGGAPTGTVDFYVCETTATAGCSPVAANLEDSGVTLTASGSTTSTGSSTAFAPSAPGTWCFSAVYSGGTNYNGSEDNTSAANADKAECATVTKAKSSITTTVWDPTANTAWTGDESTGAKAYDTSAVSGVPGFTPGGTVTYAFFHNGDCANQAATSQAVNLTDTGLVPNSAQTSALAPGNYSYLASYSGDDNYLSSTATCEPFSVGLAASSTATIVDDATTGQAWSQAPHVTGDSANDTATVSVDGTTATGTVTYNLFANGTCAGSPTTTETVNMSTGAVPDSKATGALPAGSYSYKDLYSGDSNYKSSTGTCEQFTVGQATPDTSTTVFDTATKAAWDKSEVTGASAYDTATVSSLGGIAPTNQVTYKFFTTGNCTGTVSFSDAVTLAGGKVPDSSTTGPLGGGSYSFLASYAGDSNYTSSTGQCEPFTVGPADSTTATVVDDATTGKAWSGDETVGATAFDTSSVTGVSGFLPTGTVSYVFYDSTNCSGNGSSPDVVNIQSGAVVPHSSTSAALAAGDYSYLATYSGDANYKASAADCEPLTVGQATPKLTTTVFDVATNGPWGTTEDAGTKAEDTSTLTVIDGFPATGNVSYTLYTTADCGGTGTAAGTVTPAGTVPDSNQTAALTPGSYSYKASFAGDSNYKAVTADCEPFTVSAVDTTTTTAVKDAKTNQNWAGTEITGAKAYDTASVTTAGTVTPTGTVTYDLYANGTCSGTVQSSEKVTLAQNGSVPQSATTSSLAAGDYSYLTSYSGDINNNASTATCEVFTVAETPPSVSATKAQDPPDGSVVGPGATVSYTITVINTGEAQATNVTVTDTVPVGATFVSADNGGSESAGGVVTWTGINLAGGASTTVGFVVTVDRNVVDNQVIPNTAKFTDVNTPNCGGAATCDTNTVKVHVVYTAPATTTTTTSTTTSTVPAETTTTAKAGGLVFTGSNVMKSIEVAGGALALGGLLVFGASRRRRHSA